AGKERPFHRRVRVWQLKQCRLTAFTLCERWLQTFTAQQRTTDQVKNFVDALHGAGGIAGGSSQSDKEPNVARDAIAHFAETRNVDKQPFLEQRGQGIVQIRKARESPQIRHDLRVLREPEEVRQKPEPILDIHV